MKYKRKQIRKIKERFNIERLHFFKGYVGVVRLKTRSIGVTIMAHPFHKIIICSLERNPKKVYRNHPYRHATRRMTHQELGEFLEGIKNGWYLTKWGTKSLVPSIWFEQTDTEHNDLESLKKAYLIHYLSGI